MNANKVLSFHCTIFKVLLTLIILFAINHSIQSQHWITYSSESFDLQFSVPDYWDTNVDEETVISEGDGIVFVLTAVKDESISTLELFEIQIETLDMDAEGEYEEIELTGGIHAYIGSGAATIEGELGAVILLAATLGENNYLAYIFCEPDYFDENEEVMVDVITSLEPYGWK